MLVLFGIWDDGFDALLCNCVFWTFLPFNIKWNIENTSTFQSEKQMILMNYCPLFVMSDIISQNFRLHLCDLKLFTPAEYFQTTFHALQI